MAPSQLFCFFEIAYVWHVPSLYVMHLCQMSFFQHDAIGDGKCKNIAIVNWPSLTTCGEVSQVLSRYPYWTLCACICRTGAQHTQVEIPLWAGPFSEHTHVVQGPVWVPSRLFFLPGLPSYFFFIFSFSFISFFKNLKTFKKIHLKKIQFFLKSICILQKQTFFYRNSMFQKIFKIFRK